MSNIWSPRFSKLLQKIGIFLKDMRTEYLVAIPSVLGFLIVGILIMFYKKPFTDKPFPTLVLSFVFILWSTGGLIMIFRREMGGLMTPIRGSQAVVTGVFLVIGCWGFALMLLMHFLKLISGG
jgi:protein-S-isoprenylcysteine O-methyltransferase Ste14